MYKKENRTDSYVMTIDPNSVSDMLELDIVRKSVNTINKDISNYLRYTYRVSLRGRKPIQKFMNRKGNMVGYGSHAILGGLKNSGEIDVYIHRRFP